MQNLRALWTLLAGDSVRSCNEPEDADRETSEGLMSGELLQAVAAKVKERGWRWTILTGRKALPGLYRDLAKECEAQVVVPADYEGEADLANGTVVMESTEAPLGREHSPLLKAILRVRRADLRTLCNVVLALLQRHRDVTLRHPDLLQYTDTDLDLYREELSKIGHEMVVKRLMGNGYRVNCLTDAFLIDQAQECGAGYTQMAVDPGGYLHICPATRWAGMPGGGHILEEVKLPNRQLLTRAYALPCKQACNALHCGRCVYLNKRATCEFSVPPRNMCRLAHLEKCVQAEMTKEAQEMGIWPETWIGVDSPSSRDPCEAIVRGIGARDHSVGAVRLLAFTGRPQQMNPVVMLDIIHAMLGRAGVLALCLKAGHVPSYSHILNDPLVRLKHRTVERYRDARLAPDCPSVQEIEAELFKLVEAKAGGGRTPERRHAGETLQNV